MNTMKNNELFLLYLQECNTIDTNEERSRERIKRKRDRIVRKADSILILMIGVSFGIMTLWTIIQEVMMKLMR